MYSLVADSVSSDNPLKIIIFQNKNPSKMYQKPHQKINNFYFMYKSPRAMLVAMESTWNDVYGPLNSKSSKISSDFHQSDFPAITVGVPIQIAGYKKAAEMEISFLVPLFGASFRL